MSTNMLRHHDRPDTAGVFRPGGHIPALDGLRGIAILLVLAFHYGRNARGYGHSYRVLTASEFGWVGVDLFFVLSGFLITGILFDSREKPAYFRNFYARRALRIFPLYYTALILTAVVSIVWSQPTDWARDGAAWVALYMTNFLIAIEGVQSVGPLAFFWSLAVEEHFYLVWPLLVLWMSRRGLMALAVVLVIVSFTLRTVLFLNGAGFEMIYFPTPTRMDGLAIGALIALAVRGPGGIVAVKPMAWLAIGITAPIIGYLTLGRVLFVADEAIMMTIGYSLIAIFFGGALIIGITWAPVNYVLSSAPLRWFGRYSYGIYVWHPIVNNIMFSAGLIALFRIDTLSKSAIYILCTIAVMLLVSVASYHFLERPFLKLKGHFEQGEATGVAPVTGGGSLQETARANSNASR